MPGKQILPFVLWTVLSIPAVAQKIEVKKDVIYVDKQAIAAIPEGHKRAEYILLSLKGDSLCTITLSTKAPYFFSYDFTPIHQTVESMDFYAPDDRHSDSFAIRMRISSGQFPLLFASKSHFLAKKIVEAGLIKDGVLDTGAVARFALKNQDAGKLVAEKEAADAAEAADAKHEAAVLASVNPTADDKGVIVNGQNDVIAHIQLRGAGSAEVSITVVNAAGQVIATGSCNSANNSFSTPGDQRQHTVPNLDYFNLAPNANMLNKQDAFLSIARYFVKKGYIR